MAAVDAVGDVPRRRRETIQVPAVTINRADLA
jgi:hypothetical protein